MEGTVECDASIMHGDHSSYFGAVGLFLFLSPSHIVCLYNSSLLVIIGALEGVKNPVSVARKLLDQRKSGLLSLGRIPPMYILTYYVLLNILIVLFRLLVGEGAKKFADISGATMVNKEELITEKSKQVLLLLII